MNLESIQFQRVLLDDKGKRIPSVMVKDRLAPKDPDTERKGTEFVYALIPPDAGSKRALKREKRKVLLKREDGTRKPYDEFKFYPNRTPRSLNAVSKALNQAVIELLTAEGYDPENQALDEAAVIRKESRRINHVFGIFFDKYEKTPVKRTLKPRSQNTIDEMKLAFGWYQKLFGNHMIDNFPKRVSEDFQLRMALQPARPGLKKMMSTSSIRKHAIALHQFFDWLTDRGWVMGKPIKLEMPSQTLTPPPDLSRMKKWQRSLSRSR